MNNNILIYGANGYTAELIIELALAEGAKPILAGRSAKKLAPLATRHGLSYRVFALDDVGVITGNLTGVAVVLNCAGPFSRTAKAMAEGCIAAGADEVIIYTEADFEAEVKRLTGGKGVDVVYDSVGKTTFAKGLNCLKPRGLMVLWGQASGPVEPFDPQLLNQKGSLFLTRPNLAAYTATRAELLERANDLFGWYSAGDLDVRIDGVYPLAKAADAHRYLEDRRTTGKVLLAP